MTTVQNPQTRYPEAAILADEHVQTFCWEGMPDAIALETMTFEDLGDGRTRLHGFSLCDFGRLVGAATDWSAPAPVPGWTARDLVRHLVDWFPGFPPPASSTPPTSSCTPGTSPAARDTTARPSPSPPMRPSSTG